MNEVTFYNQLETTIGCVHLLYQSIQERGEGKDIAGEDVTVLIPCFRKAPYIKEAIQSVLDNTVQPKAIKIFLMDAESKALKKDLEGMSPIVECMETKRLGICKGRNKLVELCETDFFTFLDADDFLYSEFFERMCKGARDFNFSEFSTFNGQFTKKRYPPLSGNLTGLFNKKAFQELGGLDAEYRNGIFEIAGGEDTDFMLTVLESNYSWRNVSAGYFLRRNGDLTSFHLSNFYTREKVIYIEKHREAIKNLYENTPELQNSIPKEIIYEVYDNNQRSFVDFYFKYYRFPEMQQYAHHLQFAITNKCNRDCHYCTQATFHEDIEWTEEFETRSIERIKKWMKVYSEKYGDNFIVSFVGGEIGLWSESFLAKIKELFDTEYPDMRTEWITNGLLVQNAHLPLPKLRQYYIHLVDWENVVIPDVPANVVYNIVVCEEDLDKIETFMERNWKHCAKINLIPRQKNEITEGGMINHPKAYRDFLEILSAWTWRPYSDICYQQWLRHNLQTGTERTEECLERAKQSGLLSVVRLQEAEDKLYCCCVQRSYYDEKGEFHYEPCPDDCAILFYEAG